jgi:hypothetical protein
MLHPCTDYFVVNADYQVGTYLKADERRSLDVALTRPHFEW